MSAESSLNNTLVLNGAEARLQIVCGKGATLLFSKEIFAPRQGMQKLVPALMEGLATMDMQLSDIERIAIVRGPGSFTGLRLVLSTALGLARPLGIPMAGINYMDALAADAAQLTKGQTWAVTHARRGLVHIQGFTGTNAAGLPLSVTEPDAATLEEAVNIMRASCGSCALLGTGVHRNLDFFAENFPEAAILPERFNHPTPETLLFLADSLSYSDEPVEAMYIRPCDAEENLATIAAAKGLDPEKAQETLEKLTGR